MVVLLLVAWAAILIPSLGIGRRLQASPIDGVRRFESFMGILANTRTTQVPGRWVMVPREVNAPHRRRARVLRRRRQAFVRLLAAAAATLVLGFVPHLRALLLAHLAVDAALALYVVRLRRWRRAELTRRVPAPAAVGRAPAELGDEVRHIQLDDESITITPPVAVSGSR